MKISLWILILTFFLPISASKKTMSTISAINYADDKPVVIELEKGKISSIMGDLAKGIKSFKKGLSDDSTSKDQDNNDSPDNSNSDNK